LGEVGFTSSTAKAQTPATVGLVFRQDGKLSLNLADLITADKRICVTQFDEGYEYVPIC